MMMLRRALLAVIASLLCGCAATPGSLGTSTGTVSGHVTIRVCGGAYRTDQNGCHVNPAAGAELSFQVGGGSEYTTAETDKNGAYHVALKPGTYSVQVQPPGSTSPLPTRANGSSPGGLVGPAQVSVSAGHTVTADFSYTIELL